MIETDMLVVVIVLLALFGFLEFQLGRIRGLMPAGRRNRALDRAIPMWEVWVGSDAPHYPLTGPGLGYNTLVVIRQVKRAGDQVRVLQKIRVAEIRGNDPPEKLLAEVDRANTMIQTLMMTGAT